MSPLAPNRPQSFERATANQELVPDLSPKYVYSLGDLYGMRHNQRRSPDLSNRNVLASISRSPPPVASSNPNGYSNVFNFNLMASALNQMHSDRRLFDQHRAPTRHQNYHNGHMSNGERHRQSYQGKFLHDL